jgi:hypothetical protein
MHLVSPLEGPSVQGGGSVVCLAGILIAGSLSPPPRDLISSFQPPGRGYRATAGD